MSVTWKVPSWSTLVVEGPDAASWLNGLLTCAVGSLAPGEGRWGSLLTKQGKVQADVQLVGDSRRVLLGISGGDARSVLAALDGYLVMEDAEIAASDERWLLAAGQEAPQALSALGLVPHRLPWGGVPLWASTTTAAGLDELGGRFTEASEATWQELRVRSGWFLYGVDYDGSDNLHAASLERRTVDWQKGCYLGQEVVCMQDMRGKVKRRLVVLEAEQGLAPGPGAPLFDVSGGSSDLAVGEVTSSAKSWAVARVNTPFDAPETPLFAPGANLRVLDLTKPFPEG